MRRTRKRRFSKREQFQFVLEALRYALANRIPLLRIVEVRSKPLAPPDYPPIEVVIQVHGLPMAQGRKVKRPISARRIAEFFKDWQIQEDFLKWYAKRIAFSIPQNSSCAELKTKFLRLKAGRTGKLPPRIVLDTEYKFLVGEIRQLQERYSGTRRSAIVHKRDDVLKFGAEAKAEWADAVAKHRIHPEELFNTTPEAAAKLTLSRQYGCTESAVHERLHRDT